MSLDLGSVKWLSRDNQELLYYGAVIELRLLCNLQALQLLVSRVHKHGEVVTVEPGQPKDNSRIPNAVDTA
jgi:hypothetical protein